MERQSRHSALLRMTGLPWLLGTLWVAGAVSEAQQEEELAPLDPEAQLRFDRRTLSAYEGTPLPVVQKMLELAEVRPNEAVYDVGSGDGRILIMAAQKFGARGVGIELDPRWCRQSLERVQKLALHHQIQIIEGDAMEQDLSAADVMTIYLTPQGLKLFKPHLERHLRHGMRIVTVENEIPGWTPDRMVAASGDNRRIYALYLYVISRPGEWVSFSKFGRKP